MHGWIRLDLARINQAAGKPQFKRSTLNTNCQAIIQQNLIEPLVVCAALTVRLFLSQRSNANLLLYPDLHLQSWLSLSNRWHTSTELVMLGSETRD